jgi:mRNA-degrading endonuclease toxin of MazEF toxin-antitoxin module
MYEHYTHEAIRVVMIAQEEARRLGHNSIGTEMLLIALIAESSGVAAKALKSAGLSTAKMRVEVEKIVGRGSGLCGIDIPYTPRAKEVVDRAYLQAREWGNQHIDTEHLLLTLLDEGEGFGIRALENAHVDITELKKKCLDLLEERKSAIEASKSLMIQQGDVVLVSFEMLEEDGKVNRKRFPMIVMSSNDCISRLSVITMIPLTSSVEHKVLDPLDTVITARSTDGKAAGLRHDSVAASTFVYSYPKRWIEAKIGTLSRETVNKICAQITKLIEPTE